MVKVLKKSACQSVAKFPSNPFRPLGILIQASELPDPIQSGWRNKIRLTDFFNRILDAADSQHLGSQVRQAAVGSAQLERSASRPFLVVPKPDLRAHKRSSVHKCIEGKLDDQSW